MVSQKGFPTQIPECTPGGNLKLDFNGNPMTYSWKKCQNLNIDTISYIVFDGLLDTNVSFLLVMTCWKDLHIVFWLNYKPTVITFQESVSGNNGIM